MSDELPLYKNINNYTKGKTVKCLGCRKFCKDTLWGKWCFDCNVSRIDRINKAFGLED